MFLSLKSLINAISKCTIVNSLYPLVSWMEGKVIFYAISGTLGVYIITINIFIGKKAMISLSLLLFKKLIGMMVFMFSAQHGFIQVILTFQKTCKNRVGFSRGTV